MAGATVVTVIAGLLIAPVVPGPAFLLAGMLIGLLLWAGTFVALYFARRDSSNAVFTDERAIAERDVHACLYRLAGKGCIAAATVFLWASQQKDIALWLGSHSRLPYALAIGGMFCVAVNEFIEIPWRSAYRREFSRPKEQEDG